MIKDDTIYLRHILDLISLIEKSISSKKKEDFKKDVDIIDAILRRIEVIGEAVKNLSGEFKEKYPEIEWKKIAGTRDILIHEYFAVDLDLVWNIIEENLPKLKEDIKKIIEKEELEKQAKKDKEDVKNDGTTVLLGQDLKGK